jgi:hypothetical protein
MLSKREHIKSKKITDVLISSDTTEAQGYLFEGGNDCAEVVHRDEDDEVLPDTDIPYSIIGEAMGVDEQLQLRRSLRMRDLYIEEEFESEEEDFEEDEDFMTEEIIMCCLPILDIIYYISFHSELKTMNFATLYIM